MSVNIPADRYWWLSEGKDLMGMLSNRRKAFGEALTASGALDAIFRNWKTYLGLFFDSLGGSIVFDTDEELSMLAANHARSILRTILNYTVANPPAWDTQAANDDTPCIEATILANQILDYEMEVPGAEETAKLAAEMCLVYKSAYALTEWDTTLGQPEEVTPGQENLPPEQRRFGYSGDRRYSVLTPFQVVFDYTLPDWKDVKWIEWTENKNKWDLAEIYPDERKDIIGLKQDWETKFFGLERGIVQSPLPLDSIEFHTAIHLPTAACPEGRIIKYAGEKVLLEDGILPSYYKRLPVHRIVHSETPGTILVGSSPMDQIAPLQEALNSELSTILTNHAQFGRPKYWHKFGEPLNEQSFQPSSQILESETPITIIGPPATSGELIAFARELIAQMRTIAGIADASMGQVSRETSGLALALQDASTVNANKSFDSNYQKLLQSMGQSIIEMYQSALKEGDKRAISVVGENHRAQLVYFTGEQLEPVQRILVQIGSPFLRTPGGRAQYAEMVRQTPGLVSNPTEILSILETGRIEKLTKAEDAQLSLCRDIVQKIRKGENNIPIQVTDNLLLIAKEVQAEVLSNVNDRFNAQYISEATRVIGICMVLFDQNPMQQAMLGWISLQQAQAYLMAKQVQNQMAMAAIPGQGPPPGGTPMPGAGVPGTQPRPNPEGVTPEAAQILNQAQQSAQSNAGQSPLSALVNK